MLEIQQPANCILSIACWLLVFFQQIHKILSVTAFQQGLGYGDQLIFCDKSFTVSYFFNASDFYALPLFNYLYKLGSLHQGIESAGI